MRLPGERSVSETGTIQKLLTHASSQEPAHSVVRKHLLQNEAGLLNRIPASSPISLMGDSTPHPHPPPRDSFAELSDKDRRLGGAEAPHPSRGPAGSGRLWEPSGRPPGAVSASPSFCVVARLLEGAVFGGQLRCAPRPHEGAWAGDGRICGPRGPVGCQDRPCPGAQPESRLEGHVPTPGAVALEPTEPPAPRPAAFAR